MSKYSYTPGPWVCHSGAVYKDGPNVWPKGEENGIPIAKMDREPDNGIIPVERDANARLIAAAPELLKALKWIIEDAATDSPEMWGFAFKAIDKAEQK